MSSKKLLIAMMALLISLTTVGCGDTWRGLKKDASENIEAAGEAIEEAGKKIKE
jgi:predicted small secreted protein